MSSKIKFQDYWFIICILLAVLFLIYVMLFRTKDSNSDIKNELFDFFGWPKRESKPRLKINKKNETKCREIFEKIFNTSFPTIRPDFLKQSNGYRLELDGYNKDLKLGFEYQGRQHYEYSPYFHRSYSDFLSQTQRDKLKKQLCQTEGITLIEIPYTVKYESLEQYIRSELKKKTQLFIS